MVSRLKIGHLIMIFALVALPFTATFALYYPDERHYTDGAFIMFQQGDWLAPHTGAGKLRFEKPILTYWVLAASWLVLGVNSFAARLPFLLITCATIGLTYRMARRFTGSTTTALLSGIILISQPQLFLSAIHNIPDALLTFFVTLSACGFLRLLALNELKPGAYWMAYGGAAGAILSKGLLGVAIVVFCWGFVWLPRRDWAALKRLLHWPSMITSVVAAVSWFACVLATYGTKAWHAFYADQVTRNLDGHFWMPLARIPLFALIVLVGFLPWSLTIAEGVYRQKKLSAGALPPVIRKFTLLWTLALVIGFSVGTNVSTRYTLPATPLLAILFADWLSAIDETVLVFSLRRILLLIVTLLSFASVLIVMVAYEWHAPLLLPSVVAGSLIALLIGLAWGCLRGQYLPRAEALGLSMLAGWSILIAAMIPILPFDSGIQTADVLKKMPGGARPVLVVDNVQLSNRLRIRLGRSWPVTDARQLVPASIVTYKYFVLPQKEAQEFANHGWRVQEVTVEPRVTSLRDLWSAIKARAVPEYLDANGKKYFLASVP